MNKKLVVFKALASPAQLTTASAVIGQQLSRYETAS